MDTIDMMDTQLCKAVMKGSCDAVRELIRNNPEILRGVTPQGNTALHVAAARGHDEMVKLLLEWQPCMLLRTNFKEETALHKAAASEALKVVQVLLNFDRGLHCSSSGCAHGIDLEACRRYPQLIWEAQNKKGETALHYAAKGGFLEVVEELLRVEGIASIVNKAGESALYTACEEGRLKVAKKLLKEDPPIPDIRSDGTSCLHAVIYLLPWIGAGRLLTLAHRLIRGLPGTNKTLDSLLSQELARELIRKRPELVKIADPSGDVPLHLATLAGDLHYQLVEDLLKVGPDMNFRLNNDNMAPIHIAARHGYLKICKCLVNSAPHCTELLGKDGKNALLLALENGHHSLAPMCLLPDSVDPIFLINEPDVKGNTVLHEEAVELCRPHFVRHWEKQALESMLRKTRWSVNAVNEEGDTPLDILISNQRTLFSPPRLSPQIFRRAGGVSKGKGNRMKKLRGNISETVEVIRETTMSEAPKNDRETLSILSGLIATVTFAAAFTIPGGADQQTGIPVLMHKAALQVFIICDTVSMCLSMLSLFLLNFFPPTPTGVRSTKHCLSEITSFWGRNLILWALYSTMAAFAAGIYVVVEEKCLWLALTVCSIIFASTLFILGCMLLVMLYFWAGR